MIKNEIWTLVNLPQNQKSSESFIQEYGVN